MARILVVDDEDNVRSMIELALSMSGYEVTTASDGPTGLEKFGDGSAIDIVLLDQRMPGMEGLEVLRQMREIKPETRVIMITAYGTIDLAVDAMKAGATDFLRKPFTTETLRGAVMGALSAEPRKPAPIVEEPAQVEPRPVLYGLSTVNGYHIESDPKAVVVENGDMTYTFAVRHPSGNIESCSVLLSAQVVSEIRLLARADYITSENRFWHALCEHVLADYLYQRAGYPPEFSLRVDEADRGIRRWVKAVVKAG